MKTAKCFRKMLSRLSREHYFFRKRRKGGKGEGAEGAPSLVKGGAVGSGARPCQLEKEDAERVDPRFRKSYGYEAWCDSLAASKHFYDLMDDLRVVLEEFH